MENFAEFTVKKRVGPVPVLCNIIGTLILLSVIALCVPMTVPRYMGYEIYNVVSGSMEPAIPVGSVIYVGEVEPSTIEIGDVIAFQSGESVIAHRVTVNQIVEGEITTKGDANAEEDFNPVAYEEVIGRVEYHLPYLGTFFSIFSSNIGKLYIICFAACGLMLNILATRIRQRKREK